MACLAVRLDTQSQDKMSLLFKLAMHTTLYCKTYGRNKSTRIENTILLQNRNRTGFQSKWNRLPIKSLHGWSKWVDSFYEF